VVLFGLVLVAASEIPAKRVFLDREEPLRMEVFGRGEWNALGLAVIVIADGVFDAMCVEDSVQLSLDFNAFEAETSLQIVPKHSIEEVRLLYLVNRGSRLRINLKDRVQ
jgi:hypothetical protein